jgi:hypothetical protein
MRMSLNRPFGCIWPVQPVQPVYGAYRLYTGCTACTGGWSLLAISGQSGLLAEKGQIPQIPEVTLLAKTSLFDPFLTPFHIVASEGTDLQSTLKYLTLASGGSKQASGSCGLSGGSSEKALLNDIWCFPAKKGSNGYPPF